MGVFVDSRLRIREKTLSLPCNLQSGRLAERLGRGLQNLVQQFESATDLIFDSAIGYTLTGCIFSFLFTVTSFALLMLRYTIDTLEAFENPNLQWNDRENDEIDDSTYLYSDLNYGYSDLDLMWLSGQCRL